jgi:hypothetical protein
METSFISLEESKEKYLLCNKELNKAFKSLEKLDSEKSHAYRKLGMYKFLKNFVSSFDVLYKIAEMNSNSSLFTLSRMIIDNYAVFYFLTFHSTDQEKNIRYYLFLSDGIKTRSDLLTNFLSHTFETVKQNKTNDTQKIKDTDTSDIEKLRKYIAENNQNNFVSEKVIKDNNWKFKDSKSSKAKRENSYTWIELYNTARIPKHYSYAFQNFYSTYVHGLGMSIMTQPENNNELKTSLALQIIAIIQSMLIKILLLEYSDFVKEENMDPEFKFEMNHHWDNWHQHER